MRLISLYVENFGCLHRYSRTFAPGLNVILESNGFGKTTLAEFIRAMFYGFPRAGKTLENNPRKKYLPWQGGKYGGSLVFSHNGKDYRIERTFGAVPRGDTFLLTDAHTHVRSEDFTENLGPELFGLDADSFERSTYLPQLPDRGPLTTGSIQAKLADLVADTNDINNYDKALEALRKKRSSYVPYKGTSGSVAEAGEQITRLQLELEALREKEPERDRLEDRLEQTRLTLSENTLRREALQRQLQLSSRQAAREALLKQRRALEASLQEARAQQAALERRYPLGFPTHRELEQGEKAALALAAPEQQPLPQDREARQLLQTLSGRFARGTPSPEELAGAKQRLQTHRELSARLHSLRPTPSREEQLTQLEALFRPGIPSEEDLAQWDALERRRSALAEQEKALETDPEALQALEAFFAPGLPDRESLEACRQKLDRAAALRREAPELPPPPAPAPPSPTGRLPLTVLGLTGLASLLTGLALLALSYPLAAGALLALGVGLLVGFFLIKQKRDRRELEQRLRRVLPVTDPLSARAADDLERQAALFLAPYPCPGATLSEKLSRVTASLEKYLTLRERQDRAAALRAQQQALTHTLSAHLAPYFGQDPRFDAHILTLRQNRSLYLSLSEAQTHRQEEAALLTQTLGELEASLGRLLEPYMGPTPARELESALSRLEQEVRSYGDAQKTVAAGDALRKTREEENAGHRRILSDLEARYALPRPLSGWPQVRQLREDAAAAAALREQVLQAQRALDAFCREHAQLLALPSREDLPSPEALEAEDHRLSLALREAEALRAGLEQQLRLLRGELDRIPELEDTLLRLRSRRQEDLDRARLLDETLRFLREAKTSLQHSYLGPIRRKFSEYMDLITREAPQALFVSPELEISLERLGQARPLSSFSAGQTDAVQLCMRLALVDALFGRISPFVVLDDPFVNLDDTHLERTLSLLKTLSAHRQLIYLTCSSHRAAREG